MGIQCRTKTCASLLIFISHGQFFSLSGVSFTPTEICIFADNSHACRDPSLQSVRCYWCLVRSWPFTGTGRFLAGLFTFLGWQPVVSQLSASGRNWFRTITTMKYKLVFCVVFRNIMLSCEMQLVLHANEQQETT